MPNVFSSDNKVLLSYYIQDNEEEEDEPIALIEFNWCILYKFGSPNDEALGGHSLYGHGIKFYGAHLVQNSNWINEIKKINSVHPRYNESFYKDLKHYIFCFHDNTFECLAEGYKISKYKYSYKEFLEKVIVNKLME